MKKRRRKGTSNFGRRTKRVFAYTKSTTIRSPQAGDEDNKSSINANIMHIDSKKVSPSPPQQTRAHISTNRQASSGVIQTKRNLTRPTNSTPVSRAESNQVSALEEMMIQEENAILFATHHNTNPTLRTSISYNYRHVLSAPPQS